VSSTRTVTDVISDIVADYTTHRDAIDAFHRAFYASRNTHGMTYFEDVPLLKNPMDLWVYQDILWSQRPTLIIETGTAHGGSALWFARQFDRMGVGHVVSIDIEPAETLPAHPRISFVTGSSLDPDVLEAVEGVASGHPRVMVVLDSDHSARHVTAELDAYAPFVTLGQYCVVEDTNINHRPVPIEWAGGPGPGPAVDAWLPRHPAFRRDPTCERYLLTFYPGGWLRRISEETQRAA
jgi:cephalosporin hydroxylase